MYAFGISSKGFAERMYCSKHFIVTNSVQIHSKHIPFWRSINTFLMQREVSKPFGSESCQNKIETRVVEKYQHFSHSREKRKSEKKSKLLRIWEQNLGLGILKEKTEHALVAIERIFYFQPQLQMWWCWSEYVCPIIFNSYVKDA